MDPIGVHRIQCKTTHLYELRCLIMDNLNIKTNDYDLGSGNSAVIFSAPEDVNLDFLRPKFLPPRN